MFEDCYVLKITNKCNNHCWFCTDNPYEKAYFKSLENIRAEIRSIKNKNILIKGGEPTLHPDIFKILDLLKNRFEDIFLLTNARSFSIKSFFEKIKNREIIILVKIEGPSKIIHNSVTGVEGSFEQTYEGLKNIVENKKRVFCIFSLCEQNFIFLGKLVDIINKTGIEGIIIENIYPKGYCKNNYSKIGVRYKESIEEIKKASQISHKALYLLNYPFCVSNLKVDRINFNLHDRIEPERIQECSKCTVEPCIGLSPEYSKMFTCGEIVPKYDVPSEICIEVTARCNLSCPFCFNEAYYSTKDLKKDSRGTDDIKKMIDKIPLDLTSQIRITGGEPLLRDDILNILKYAKKKGFRIWLNTNGTLINEENAQEIAKYVDNVLIPLNGYDSETDKIATGNNLFNKKINSIKLLKASGVKTVRCGTVATKTNIANLSKFYSLVLKLGIDDWELYRPIALKKEDIEESRENLKKWCTDLTILNETFNKDFKIVNALPFCFSDDPEFISKICIGAESDDGHTRMVIGANGIIRPSYFLTDNLGSIYNSNLRETWNLGFLSNMRRLQNVDISCKDCKYLNNCKGGSRYFSRLYYGNYNSKDPLMKND